MVNADPIASTPATLPSSSTLVVEDYGDRTKAVLDERAYFDPTTLLQKRGLALPPSEDLKDSYGRVLHGTAHSCKVDLGQGATLRVINIGPYFFAEGLGTAHIWNFRVLEAETPFVRAEVLGEGYFKEGVLVRELTRRDPWSWTNHRTKVGRDEYAMDRDNSAPYVYIKVRLSTSDGWPLGDIEARLRFPNTGVVDLGPPGSMSLPIRTSLFGKVWDWSFSLGMSNEHRQSGYNNRDAYVWAQTHTLLQSYEIKQGKDALWARFFEIVAVETTPTRTKGVKAIEAKKDIRENLDKLKAEEPLLWSFFCWLHDEKTRESVSNNNLLAAFLENAGRDYEALKEGLNEAREAGLADRPSSYSDITEATRPFALALPGARAKDEEKRAHKEWYLRKTTKDQAIGIGIDPKEHKRLLAAIERGDIPLSLFHVAGDQLQPVNTEFDLWEKAFARPGWEPVLCEIAKSAAGRAKFEKDVTPYIAFLFRIEGYLDRHTGKGKKWRAIPKFVESEWDLEMEEATEEGTTKRRSAMTPVPDNHERTVTVPYVSIRMSGVVTTYCYSLMYQVFEENTCDLVSETPITHELEKRLNNRDDYGLMYYTLTGSARATGYPSFLIIFERRARGTHVHIHRVHPCRSKGGKTTPASKLIQEGYRYMAGNIRAEEIFAQQGDLIFIQTTQDISFDPTTTQRVKEFESHAFVPGDPKKPILFIPNEAKSIPNRLGFLYSEGQFAVEHPEHDPLAYMPAGTYEVRRCKSWEANPKAVWVLTID